MKVLIVGSGAVGGYFGGRLSEAGYDVTFLARGAHLDALKENGLNIQSINGDFSKSVQTTDCPVGLFDLIFFSVKSDDLAHAAKQVQKNIAKDTAIVSLLNGIDSEKTLSTFFGPEKIIAGIAFIGSTVSAPGVIKHTAAGSLIVGELDGKESQRCENIKKMFSKANVPCKISKTITKDLWNKMVWNVGFNALTAITDSLVSDVLSHPGTTTIIKKTMQEALCVAQAEGVLLSTDLPEMTISKTRKAGAIKTSMLQDIRSGKKTEIEAINGTVVRLGKVHGVSTPVNETLCSLVSFREKESHG